ncbi:MAG: hypothetical protein PHY57_07625 [Ignavibacterium sp.]|jgi:hypothetical protein|nr:hypothetical protein [Ignavibacterium sp.]MDX9713222.1 hypothetical protein [Ignavibacteriaceae bacterium]GIK23392.1 MAG: hypothetical protein BroJett005_28060 [Ignavibacteriota bacterium]MDD5608365.1 hypothetical protein [Ignavibacterium sp.]HMN18731.1 hypothetical protein [Ignavibacteriaceae bacterium]
MQTELKNEKQKNIVTDIAFYGLVGLLGLSALAAVVAIVYWIFIG